jgi:hypothetical protein
LFIILYFESILRINITTEITGPILVRGQLKSIMISQLFLRLFNKELTQISTGFKL